MKPRTLQSTCRGKLSLAVTAIFFLGLLTPVHSQTPAQQAQSQEMTTTTSDAADTQQAPKLPNDQLDSLVAPIALYPDALLAQTLAASTYPLEVIQLQQWMGRNKDLKDKALADAVAKQPWDPSVQSMVMFPDVVQRMADNIQWTTDLGNAFLAQESDVMAAAQRMRAKAQGTGNRLLRRRQSPVAIRLSQLSRPTPTLFMSRLMIRPWCTELLLQPILITLTPTQAMCRGRL
jgi:hypothetical protein